MNQFSEIECVFTRVKQVTNDCSCVNQVSLPWENCSFELKEDSAPLFPPLHAVPGFNPVFTFHFCFLPLRQGLALSFKVTLTWCASRTRLGWQGHTILYYYSGLKIFVMICLDFSSQQGWRAPTLNLIKAFWTSWTIFLPTPKSTLVVLLSAPQERTFLLTGSLRKKCIDFFFLSAPLASIKVKAGLFRVKYYVLKVQCWATIRCQFWWSIKRCFFLLLWNICLFP